jgi:hypothetical protein
MHPTCVNMCLCGGVYIYIYTYVIGHPSLVDVFCEAPVSQSLRQAVTALVHGVLEKMVLHLSLEMYIAHD